MGWFTSSLLSGGTAPTPQEIDNFEGDLTPYTGNTADYSINTTTGKVGNSLSTTAVSGASIYSTQGSGLLNYPSSGNKITYYVRGDIGSNARGELRFGGTSINDCYSIEVAFGREEFNIFKFVGGAETVLQSSITGPISRDSWYYVEATWQLDGTFAVELFQPDETTTVASLNVTDTTYSEGGVGFRAITTNSYYWDQIQQVAL